MSNIIVTKKKELQQVANQNRELLSTLNEEDRKSFVDNFQELASNDYLMNMIKPKELMKFCVDITKIGLNINPMRKQVYIVPFNTEINKTKIMMPQAIIPDKGWKELAYRAGFFLRIDPIFNINGSIKAESELSREDQTSLNSSDPKWVDDVLMGYDIVLEDLKGDIPLQKKFVEVSYCRAVTKTLKDDRFKIQSWKHKAVRRAMSDFFIPSSRGAEKLEEVDNINDNVVIDVDYKDSKPAQVQQKKSFEDAQKDNFEAPNEATRETIIHEIQKAYKDAGEDGKLKISSMMSRNAGWREYDIEKLKALLEEVQS